MEMVFWDVVVLSEMALGLVPEVLDAADVRMLTIDELLEMTGAMVMKA